MNVSQTYYASGRSLTITNVYCVIQLLEILEELKLIYDEKYHSGCCWKEVEVRIDQIARELSR